MSFQYDQYLTQHRSNVKRGFDWIAENLPELLVDGFDYGWQIEFAHDKSKDEQDEYEAYDAYFYVFLKERKMKQPKKLTREQKECLSAHYLNCKDWMLVEETDFYYRIINKNTGVIKSVDKFRKMRRRK